MAAPRLADTLLALQRRAQRGMVLGLGSARDALAILGNPHTKLACVHVAGSNGKGSTTAMIESIARTAGLTTGMYTSPHLCRFAERIRLNGDPIGDDAFARSLDRVLELCAPELTVFETLTLAAFDAFRDASVDLAIVEVGLGGRLDATNVIEAPLATAITSITLEHADVLGESIEAIAREKAGIVKRGAPLILGPLSPEAEGAIREVARATGSGAITRVVRAERRVEGAIALCESSHAVTIVGPRTDDPTVITTLGLRGPHQAENAAVAVGVARHLASRWPAISEAIPRGLAEASWPGRMERITRDGITLLLDCAHNPEGARALAAALAREGLDPSRTALVFGALADKQWQPMLGALAPFASRRYYTEPKGRTAASLADLNAFAPGRAITDPRVAIACALRESQPGDCVLVTGSIYLVGEVRAEVLGIAADPVIAL